MHKLILFLATACLLVSLSAYAQKAGSVRYKWHDSQGLLHFSDSLSIEAMKHGYDIVNDRGMTVGRVARQLTPEERAAANKLAAEQEAERQAARKLANIEAQMLNAYPDEESFRISQQQSLETIDQQIHTTQINLRSQEKALTDLLGRAADLESSKESVPKVLGDSISKQRDVVAGQRNALRRQQAERASTVESQAVQLQRYRELKAQRQATQ